MDSLENSIPPWTAYQGFVSGCLIALDKLPGVHLVGVGRKWRKLFNRSVLKVMGHEATYACKDHLLCVGLNVGINKLLLIVYWIVMKNTSSE